MKKVNQKQVLEEGLPALAGAGLAVFATNAVGNALLPEAGATVTKNDHYKKAAVHAILTGLFGYGIMAIDGNDAGSNALKGAAFAGAGANLIAAVKSIIDSNDKVTATLQADTAAAKFVRKGLGLACPCESARYAPALGRPRYNGRRNPRALRMPANVAGYAAASNSAFANALNTGAQLVA